MIPPEIIQEIKRQAHVFDIVPLFVTMKRDGKDLSSCCPFHDEKTPSFKLNKRDNFYKCFGCGEGGDVIQFLMKHKHWGYIESLRFLANHYHIDFIEDKPKEKRSYAKPTPRTDNLSPAAIAMFNNRKISRETLEALKVTGCKTWMPKTKTDTDVICFNYYKDNELINIKYRSVNDKDFMLSKDAELILYNLDSITGAKSCCIVEGEVDALTLYECGFKSVVSVPNGASGTNLEYLDNYIGLFDKMDKVYIFTDNDAPGVELKNELARRIGFEKCMQVSHLPDCKDANDILVKYGKKSVQDAVKYSIEFPCEGIYSLDELGKTVYDYYKFGYPKGCKIGIDEFDRHIQFVSGQFTVVTGIPSHGKSEFINMVVSKLAINYGWKCGIMAFENEPAIHISQIQEKIVGKSFNPINGQQSYQRMDDDEFSTSIDYINDNFFFIKTDEIDASIDGILTLAADLVKRKGIKQFVLDPWNYIEFSLNGENETQHISKSLTKIKRFCSKYGVHLFLIAHPTKMPKTNGKYDVPGLYNISGSAHFKNKTYNGIVVYRDFVKGITEVTVEKVKYHWLGEYGTVEFSYNIFTRQYEPIVLNGQTTLNIAHTPAQNEQMIIPEGFQNAGQQLNYDDRCNDF